MQVIRDMTTRSMDTMEIDVGPGYDLIPTRCFLIQSVYDFLPINPICTHCTPIALGEGCCHWLHDQVLRVTADVISTGIAHSRQQQPTRHPTNHHLCQGWAKASAAYRSAPDNSMELAAEG